MPFKTMSLADPLVQGILAAGYTAPTEIQSRAIPLVLSGSDLIACAQTGTGKTAAFVLPILDRLHRQENTKKKVIKSLILAPTRELVVQIDKAIGGYGRFLPVRTAAIYGGVKIQGQFKTLGRGVDIVIATPGRLIDHMQRRTVDFRHVEVLVLDEADRMLDMGFINDVRKIIAALPQKRQTLLFSATISREVQALAAGIMKSPERVQIGPQQTPIETVTQHIYPVPKERKMDLLLHLLGEQRMTSVLVFSRTKHGADKIRRRLKDAGISSVAIHSGRTQSQRLEAMEGFRRGQYQVMVATDIAARGINILGISHVVNYDVPSYAEDYIHRIGRTGRATATGDAVTFVSPDEMTYLGRIERFIGRKFTLAACKGLTAPEVRPPKQTAAAGHPNAQGNKKKKFYRGHRKHTSFKKAGAA
jgi:ATP-dependent RNA helicase RhlE